MLWIASVKPQWKSPAWPRLILSGCGFRKHYRDGFFGGNS